MEQLFTTMMKVIMQVLKNNYVKTKKLQTLWRKDLLAQMAVTHLVKS
jgi:hypothetical protein